MRNNLLALLGLCLPLLSGAQTSVVIDIPCNDISNWNTAYTIQDGNAADASGNFQSVAINGDYTDVKAEHTGDTYYNSGVTFLSMAGDKTNAGTFTVIPEKGVTFTPTKVSGLLMRDGTDGGTFTIKASNGDGKDETLGSELVGPRIQKTKTEQQKKTDEAGDKFTPAFAYTTFDDFASTTPFTLSITLTGSTDKHYGISAIRIEGTVSGTPTPAPKHSLTLAVSPDGAGTIAATPALTQVSEGASVDIAAQRNFGYKFLGLYDASDTKLTDEDTYKLTMGTSDVAITAKFEAINTYTLSLAVEGVPADKKYLLLVTPKGDGADGLTYETGASVTVTASELLGGEDPNPTPFVSFSKWADGSTNKVQQLTMDANKSLTATYATTDIIAGWDFYTANKNARPADWASDDNTAASLTLQDANGTATTVLDKSLIGTGGTEGKPAAVNWKGNVGDYNFYTTVKTSGFSDIKVSCFMEACSSKAHETQNIDYSTDGTTWVNAGSITVKSKVWTYGSVTLPAACDNQSALHLRWMSDKTSAFAGTSGSTDGQALSQVMITGTPGKDASDQTAPTLTGSTPANNGTGASASGKIVLQFSEKVVLDGTKTATLTGGTKTATLTGAAAGSTVTFAYKGLVYGTAYTFELDKSAIQDRNDNPLAANISIAFTTQDRAAVTKALYDRVVGTTDELVAAIKDANDLGASNTKRFRIFIKNGNYKLPNDPKNMITGESSGGKAYPAPFTVITASNISLIGESTEGVVITNTLPELTGTTNPLEGIKTSNIFWLKGTDTYLQNITVRSSMGDAHGRDIEVLDGGTRTIYKDVYLHGFQDTWTSDNAGYFYFETCKLRGRTDYVCGKGDAFFNQCELVMCEKEGYIAVPSNPVKYGFVFKDCVITGEKADINGTYFLGRPWGKGTPTAYFIDTRMEVLPTAAGWTKMSGGWPKRFAEYNSKDANGNVVDLSKRATTVDEGAHNDNVPVLTQAEAEAMTLDAVLAGSTDWAPATLTEQCDKLAVTLSSDKTKLQWTADPYALLYVVERNGKFVAQTTDASYELPTTKAAGTEDKWTVRSANLMGGLGEASDAVDLADLKLPTTALDKPAEQAQVLAVDFFNIRGERLQAKPQQGLYIAVARLANGKSKSQLLRAK